MYVDDFSRIEKTGLEIAYYLLTAIEEIAENVAECHVSVPQNTWKLLESQTPVIQYVSFIFETQLCTHGQIYCPDDTAVISET